MYRFEFSKENFFNIMQDSEQKFLSICDDKTNETYILKQSTLGEEKEKKYLENEVTCLKAIRSDYVIQLVDYFVSPKRMAILLEDFGGVSLDKIKDIDQESFSLKVNLFSEMAKALQDLHARSYVHQAIHPTHFLWNRENNKLKLTGFKFATRRRSDGGRPLKLKDLPEDLTFISPEQTGRMNRSVDLRSDIYSLGICFYQLYYGYPPFNDQDPNTILHKHLSQNIEFPEAKDSFEEKLQEVIAHMCEKAPEGRYQSCNGLVYDLNLLCQAYEKKQLDFFCVGVEDRPLHLKLPEKSYGRSKELNALKSAFDNLYRTRSESFLISGESGVGKTYLVNELMAETNIAKALFLSSKFDQFKGDCISTSIIECLDTFFEYVLSSDQATLDKWTEHLQKILGLNARVMTDVIAPLRLILKDQPTPAELGPGESQQRFELLLIKIFRCFSNAPYPVVMFLDDLQWASPRSLGFIQKLSQDKEISNFFFIGAFRANELKGNSPLESLVASYPKGRLLEISPLNNKEIRELLIDSFGDLAELDGLEKIILEKTAGNPFEVKELLKILERKELIQFNTSEYRWVIDIPEISRQNLSNNVVDLLLSQMKELSSSSRELISLCSALGNQFYLDLIAETLECSTESLDTAVLELVENQFIRVSDPYLQSYHFCHDKIQEAAYELLSAEEKKELHYRIGRRGLLLDRQKHPYVDSIFLSSHLNQAIDLCDDEIKLKLIELNSEASQVAKASTAFSEALSWLSKSVSILAKYPHLVTKERFFDLKLEEITLLYITGDYLESEKNAQSMLSMFDEALQLAKVYDRLAIQYTAEGRYAEAIEAGRSALSLLNIDLPSNVSEKDVAIELQSLKELLQAQSNPDYSTANELTNPKMKMAMNILINLDSPCYLSQIELYCIVVAKSIRISAEFGVVPESAKAFASYGIVLCAYGEFKTAYEYTLQGIAIGERFSHLGQICRACHTMANHVQFWSEHIEKGDVHNDRGFNAGYAAGEHLWAGFIKLFKPYNQFFRARDLADLQVDVDTGIQFCEDHPNQIGQDSLKGLKILCNELMDIEPTNSHIKKQYIADCREQNSLMALSMFLSVDTFLNIILSDLEEAKLNISESKSLLSYSFSVVTNVYDYFSESFLLLSSDKDLEKEDLDLIKSNQKALKNWSDNCEQNFGALYWIVEGKYKEKYSSMWESVTCYEKAAELSFSANFNHLLAFSNECLSEAWKKMGKSEIAEMYIKKAIGSYKQWGAERKVALLIQSLGGSGATGRDFEHINKDKRIDIDLYAVLDAYQVMGKKLIKEELLEAMLQLLVRTGAATGGSIFLYNTKTQVLEQAASHQMDTNAIAGAFGIIQYVWRTKEALGSDRLSKNRGLIFKDKSNYVMPLSVQCSVLQDIGVIYLENNRVAGVFTQDRVRILTMFVNQLKISLDNISLYEKLSKFNEELEFKVNERTKDLSEAKEKAESYSKALRQTQNELLETARIAGRADVVANVLHNVGNATTLLMGHLEILESQLELEGTHDFLGILKDKLGKPREELITFLKEDSMGESMPDIFEDLYALSEEFRAKSNSTISVIKEKIQLITKLIVSERTEMRKMKISHQVNLKDLCTEAVRIVDADKFCEIDWQFRAPELVFLDAAKVKNIIINLLQNSVRACQGIDWQAKIFIGTKVYNSNLEIEITDNGIGMTKELLSKIFDPGFSTKKQIGSGYGLHNSANIAMQLGGRLEASSDGVNLGASFTLVIPFDKEGARSL